MAPELRNTKKLVEFGKDIDIFSFGIVLYEIFTGNTVLDFQSKINQYKFRAQKGKFPADIPNWLSKLILRCTSKTPSKRPSASDILCDIQYYTQIKRSNSVTNNMDRKKQIISSPKQSNNSSDLDSSNSSNHSSLSNSSSSINEFKELNYIWYKRKKKQSCEWIPFSIDKQHEIENAYQKNIQNPLINDKIIPIQINNYNLLIDFKLFKIYNENDDREASPYYLDIRRQRKPMNEDDKNTEIIIEEIKSDEDDSIHFNDENNYLYLIIKGNKKFDCSDIIIGVCYCYKGLKSKKTKEKLFQFIKVEKFKFPYQIRVPILKKNQWATISFEFHSYLPQMIDFPLIKNQFNKIILKLNEISDHLPVIMKYQFNDNKEFISEFFTSIKGEQKLLQQIQCKRNEILTKILSLTDNHDHPRMQISSGHFIKEYYIYNGISGYAYFLWKYSLQVKNLSLDDKKKYLSIANSILNISIHENQNDLYNIGFLQGISGLYALQSSVYYELNDRLHCLECINKLIAISNHFQVPEMFDKDVILGFSGYFSSILFVLKYIPHDILDVFKIIPVLQLCYKIFFIDNFDDDKNVVQYSFRNIEYSGASHGLSGILFILLHIRKVLNDSFFDDKILSSLHFFIDHFINKDTGECIVRLSGSESSTYWCRGSAGVIPTLLRAYESFPDDSTYFLNLAKLCGDFIWKNGIVRKGFNLCHGIYSGAYAFLQLYQITKDNKYLYYAYQFTCSFNNNRIFVNVASYKDIYRECIGLPDHLHSLMEGIAGEGCLLIDMENPKNASFPGFWNDLYWQK